MTGAADWIGRVGDVWAAEWRRTDRSLADLSRHLYAAIAAAMPAGVWMTLDVGCGAGATSLAAAAARPDRAVVGIDLSRSLIAEARRRSSDSRVRFLAADVAADDLAALVAPAAPDLIVSRHGVMFFADPVAAFARLCAVARPGAALVFTCFAAATENAFVTIPLAALGQCPPTAGIAPGPFAFADPVRVAAIHAAAGWADATPTRIPFAYRVGAGDDPVADAVGFLSRIGPAASILRDAPAAARAALCDRLAAALEPHRRDDVVDLPATAWLWRARNPGGMP